MAHLPPNAAIFSPSVARAAASAAKDWSYVDGWLRRKFPPGSGPPSFERNPDTLRALLALAAANEVADEERALVARLEADALAQLRAHDHDRHGQQQSSSSSSQDHKSSSSSSSSSKNQALADAREAILAALESSLTRDGQAALEAMAALAVQSGSVSVSRSGTGAAALGAELVALSAERFAAEQALARLETLTAYIEREAAATARLAAELRPPDDHPLSAHAHRPHTGEDEEDEEENRPSTQTPSSSATAAAYKGYHPPTTLALDNLAAQRRIRALAARIPELQERAAQLSRSLGNKQPSSSIEHVRREEEAYLSLLAQKRELEAQVRAFQGLPPDADRARGELESLRSELRRVTARRDEAFEGLVERESPVKGGRR